MARSRNIKPGFFTNEDLVELDFATRLLFAGLWTIADREGRLQDRPKKIKINVFPADNVNVEEMLQSLHDMGFVQRYEINGERYLQIVNWTKHQNPHHTEKASDIPGPNGELTVKDTLKTKESPSDDGGNLADSLIPDSLNTDSLIPDSGKEEKPPRKRSDPPPACPDDVDPQVWSDWLTLRKAKRAPVTDTVLNLARQEAGKADLKLSQFLSIWCSRGSQGLQASWLKQDEIAVMRRHPPNTETAYQRSMRERYEEATGKRADSRTVIDITPITLEIPR